MSIIFRGLRTALLIGSMLIAVSVVPLGSNALASDPICTNPVTAAEILVCDDEYLQGIEFQINNILFHHIAWRTGILDDQMQFRFANYQIEREQCGDNFRCVEGVMRSFLDEMHTYYFNNEDTIYGDDIPLPFIVFQSEASHGNDMLVWNDPRNFGWTEKLCQMRCSLEDECVAAAFDPMQWGDGKPGLCVLKNKAVFPLQSWTSTGTFWLKR